MAIAFILGTRPEIIKLAPVIRAAQQRQVPFVLVHTGQHYSYNMDRVFFEQLSLPGADVNLEVGSGPHGQQTGRMLERLERVFMDEPVDCVVVQGDTNTVLAGALAAVKLHIPVGHVEAGLRSFDRTMPEEHNRVVADHLSRWLFAPTQRSAERLRAEGIREEWVHVTGNTIVDSVLQNRAIAQEESDVLDRLGLTSKGYVLLTAHRAENVDDPKRFAALLEGAARVADAFDLPVVYPIHPRSRQRLEAAGARMDDIRLIDPVDFLDFLRLESDAHLVLTDSGGVQEETCILRVPCVTLRDNTERPETVDVGANRLAGVRPEAILDAALDMDQVDRTWDNPFGDGHASTRILDLLEEDP